MTHLIREATADDWPHMWRFMRTIVAAGDTFSWATDLSEADAHGRWFHEPPGRTFVAVDGSGTIVGTAESEPNHDGPGAHVATAGFMVDPECFGQGVGRALAEHVLAQARTDGYLAMQFNAVVEVNTRAVGLWRALGFELVGTVPQAFRHPTAGLVGLHVMYRRL